ncbi:MFS transporter [Caldicellulosiruptor sp. F32]|uniref:MFS transporter n=1 Tax=Caldicellulosiruptor sp. F32 TaxID=1214564 RepID=UPI0003AA725F|nr:MFS transporter [Caldicellulosiruptor sp. F32]
MKINKNISLLIASQVISDIGNWIDRVAVLTLIYEMSKSSIKMSILSIVMLLPSLLFGTVAGKLVDSYNKKSILLLGDFIRAVLVFLVSLLPNYVIGLVFIIASVTVFYETAQSSIVVELAKKEKLRQINSLSNSLNSIMMIIGPSIGGLLSSQLNLKYCFYIDSLTFLASMILVLMIEYKKFPISKLLFNDYSKPKFTDGIKYIKTNYLIRTTLMVNGLIGLSSGTLNGLMMMYVFEYLKTNSQGYGFILTSKGIAMVLSSLFAYKYLAHIKIELIFIMSLFGLGITTTVFSLNNLFFLALVIHFLNGIFNSFYTISRTTIIQQNCDVQHLGRIFALNTMFVNTSSIISLFVGGIITKVLSIRTTFIICSIFIIALSFFTGITFLKGLFSSSPKNSP